MRVHGQVEARPLDPLEEDTMPMVVPLGEETDDDLPTQAMKRL